MENKNTKLKSKIENRIWVADFILLIAEVVWVVCVALGLCELTNCIFDLQNQDAEFEIQIAELTTEIENLKAENEIVNSNHKSLVQAIEDWHDLTYNDGTFQATNLNFEIPNEPTTDNLVLTEYDRWYIECVVAGEAWGESIEGQMAVAQCIKNAMLLEEYTPAEVRKIYQYSGWMENLKTVNPKAYKSVKAAVWRVFDNGESVTDEYILWFYAPKKSQGVFHNTQKFVMEIGNHRFYAPWEDWLENKLNH